MDSNGHHWLTQSNVTSTGELQGYGHRYAAGHPEAAVPTSSSTHGPLMSKKRDGVHLHTPEALSNREVLQAANSRQFDSPRTEQRLENMQEVLGNGMGESENPNKGLRPVSQTNPMSTEPGALRASNMSLPHNCSGATITNGGNHQHLTHMRHPTRQPDSVYGNSCAPAQHSIPEAVSMPTSGSSELQQPAVYQHTGAFDIQTSPCAPEEQTVKGRSMPFPQDWVHQNHHGVERGNYENDSSRNYMSNQTSESQETCLHGTPGPMGKYGSPHSSTVMPSGSVPSNLTANSDRCGIFEGGGDCHVQKARDTLQRDSHYTSERLDVAQPHVQPAFHLKEGHAHNPAISTSHQPWPPHSSNVDVSAAPHQIPIPPLLSTSHASKSADTALAYTPQETGTGGFQPPCRSVIGVVPVQSGEQYPVYSAALTSVPPPISDEVAEVCHSPSPLHAPGEHMSRVHGSSVAQGSSVISSTNVPRGQSDQRLLQHSNTKHLMELFYGLGSYRDKYFWLIRALIQRGWIDQLCHGLGLSLMATIPVENPEMCHAPAAIQENVAVSMQQASFNQFDHRANHQMMPPSSVATTVKTTSIAPMSGRTNLKHLSSI